MKANFITILSGGMLILLAATYSRANDEQVAAPVEKAKTAGKKAIVPTKGLQVNAAPGVDEPVVTPPLPVAAEGKGAPAEENAQSVSERAAETTASPGLPPADAKNVLRVTELEGGGSVVADWAAPQAKWRQTVICTLERPGQIQRYGVRCTGASQLDARAADCCLAGDHWEAKTKSWDRAPNTAVTTAPGPANVFGVTSRVYNYGGTPQNLGSLSAEVDCSYLDGVDVFPASSLLVLSSDGSCTVTDLSKRDEINRTP